MPALSGSASARPTLLRAPSAWSGRTRRAPHTIEKGRAGQMLRDCSGTRRSLLRLGRVPALRTRAELARRRCGNYLEGGSEAASQCATSRCGRSWSSGSGVQHGRSSSAHCLLALPCAELWPTTIACHRQAQRPRRRSRGLQCRLAVLAHSTSAAPARARAAACPWPPHRARLGPRLGPAPCPLRRWLAEWPQSECWT